jgi:[NiFe] hydrogenase large subunit/hydrogenase large subunit
MSRIAIDPITRIGGHLRIEAEIADGAVRDAWSSGTMFRGMELILRGRDPRDAWLFAQRVCGSCTSAHALASVRAVENAFGVTVPRNARLVRNILAGTTYVLDHVVHFYHLHAFDWVDVMSALKADPASTVTLAHSISAWPQSTVPYFKGVQEKLTKLVDSGQLGLLANGYWGHPAYRLPPEANLIVVAHYLEALDWQRRVSRIHTILGGKNPHPQTYLVGGMALAPEWGGPAPALPGEHPQQVDKKAPTALSERGLADIADLLAEARAFVEQVYVPDVLAVAGYYREWAAIGRGIGNYLSYGEFPEDESAQPRLLLPAGRVMGRALTGVEPVDQANVAESVAHSYYTYDGPDELRHPSAGQTSPRYAGPPLPFTTLEGSTRYSWLKAPRYDGQPMEVGALARMLVGFVEGRAEVRAGVQRAVAALGGGPDALFGTLGRIVARAIEAQVIATSLAGWLNDLRGNLAGGDLALVDLAHWDPSAWPAAAAGWSLGEAPRGALGHWVAIDRNVISSYQIVDASTWNGSPRDGGDRRGAWEEALVGTPVIDPTQPLEMLRVVHSFDPCTACAVHAHGGQPGGPVEIRVAGSVGR